MEDPTTPPEVADDGAAEVVDDPTVDAEVDVVLDDDDDDDVDAEVAVDGDAPEIADDRTVDGDDDLPWAGPDTAAVAAVVAQDDAGARPSGPVADLPDGADEPAPALGAVPPVVAVMVTHDPGPWLEETLQTFVDQSYPDLALLVVDTASAVDPTPRIAAVAPEAHVHRLDHDPGYGAAANLVADLVEGASFYAFCHDDVALEPDTIRSLVEEAFRSNAGIIGPKLVRWDDPRRLLQVGMGADKTGVPSPIAEPGELDQEQHDAVRDVFIVPGGCTLVRADLFDALGGYDAGIDFLGEDLDLCWRAHALGARVLIGPGARVRHLQALGERRPIEERRGRLARHRLRTTLVTYGLWHRIRVLPQALLLAVIEALYGLVSGRPGHARDVLGAWTWNLRRLPDIRRRRAALRKVRRVGDAEIRGFQVRGSARMNAFVRGQLGTREDRVSTFARSSRDLAGSLRDGARQLTGAFAILLTIVLVVCSRDLITGGIPAIGELARFPSSPRVLLETWWSGWRRGGLGGPGASPTGFGLLGVAGYVLFGAMGLLRDVLVLATVPIGALGAWRLARPIGSARASVAAFAVYLAIPVPYNALARGSWSGLLLYAVSPWILLVLGRASGVAPFGPVGVDPPVPGPGERARPPAPVPPRRRRLPLVLGLGLALGVVASFVPVVLPIVVAITAAYALGSLFVFRIAGVVRMVTVSLGAVLLALLLNVPWSVDLLTSASPWEAAVGVRSTAGGPLTLGRILRFESGPWGAPPLGWAFLLAGALPIVIGRSWRLEWAVRAWFVVLGGWALLWAGQTGRLPVGLPAAEVVLAPVAAALALTAALGLAAFETDLRAYRFGWRQLLSVAAALGVGLGALPLTSGLIDGRWRMPTRDFSSSLDTLVASDDAAFRVLWIGDANLLPVTSWRYDADLAYATTDRGLPTVLDRLPSPPPGSTGLLADALRLAETERTNRLGHLLAPMGVRYLVVPTQLSPTSDEGTGASGDDAREAADDLSDVLAQQLDLEQVPVRDGLVVYRNAAWVSSRSVLPARSGDRTDPTEAVGDDLTAGVPALAHDRGAVDATGTVPAEGDLLIASTADPGWGVEVDGVPLARGETYGWANQFTASRTGRAVLSYATPPVRRLALAGQAVLWLLVLLARRRSRATERIAVAEAMASAPRAVPVRRARRERRAARRGRPTDEAEVGLTEPPADGRRRRGRRRGRPERDGEDG